MVINMFALYCVILHLRKVSIQPGDHHEFKYTLGGTIHTYKHAYMHTHIYVNKIIILMHSVDA